jgi:hypothetical protein
MSPKATKSKTKSNKAKPGPVCRWPSERCLAAIRRHRRAGRERPVIMVSSSVYGIEPLLNQIEAVLKPAGWEVWMSKAGSFQVDSDYSAMVNCLHAVEDCDAFLGIITGRYGSGRDKHGVSFSHREMELAIKLGWKRWFLVQHEIVVARSLCRALQKVEPGLRQKTEPPKDGLKKNPHLDSWRILDMYDLAVRDGAGPLEDRAGNWAQPYKTDDDAMLYVRNQLLRPLLLFPQYIPTRKEGAQP